MVTAPVLLRERLAGGPQVRLRESDASVTLRAPQVRDAALTKVVFVHPDGTREAHASVAGETVMDCALDHGVVGIGAQCGGACTCVTCHCYVESPWFELLAPPRADELEMLEYAWARRTNSRLACQIVLDSACAGIIIRIPSRQA